MTVNNQQTDTPPSRPQGIAVPHGKPTRTILFGKTEDDRETMFLFVHPEEDALGEQGDVISAAEVSAWFCEVAPRWGVPTDGYLRPLVHLLNIIRVTDPLSQDTAHPNTHPLERVKNAIKTLRLDLPGLIEASRKSYAAYQARGQLPFLSDRQIQAVENLLAAVEVASGSFFWPARRYRSEPWHKDALAIAWHAARAWHAAGQTRIGKNPTSPLVKVIELSFARIGAAPSAEAISKALQRTIRRSELSRTT